jgi:peptide/nickel transport system substrate-binding protein
MSQIVSRRTVLGGFASAGGLLLLAACGGSSGSAAKTSPSTSGAAPAALPKSALTTLRTAWSSQDMPFDPATFYGGPGFSAMGSLYEGLVQYKAGGVEIIPQLATSWKVSPDGKTYTFTLRDGVKFHDGTAVDAAAFKYSFQRFIDLKGAPSYLLGGVASLAAPDATTFVITLKSVVEPFLHYLACYVGPKAMSPTALKANAGKDSGATYLSTHDVGTGPYTITAAKSDAGYTLGAFAGYWGEKAVIDTVLISIIPDVTTQVLSLKKGDLDMVTSQVPTNLQSQLKSDGDLSNR